MKKILFITNMYPTDSNPADGIFIKEQIDHLTKYYKFSYEIFLINSVHKTKFEYFKSIFSISRCINRYIPDIIHIHYGLSGFFLLFFKPKVKTFLTLHGSDFNNRGSNYLQVWLSRRIISRVDTVFVQNPTMRDNALKYNKSVEILTCGVDTDFFTPEEKEKERDEKIILFPSSPLRSVKNYPLFLQVIKELKEQYHHKIAIQTLENVNRFQVKQLLNGSDCLLLTSTTEGSPQVIKESLSCGLPVISVPVGDVAEMVKEVPNCYVSTSHNAKELAKLVDKSLNNGTTGIRETFLRKKHFSSRAITNRLANYYGIDFTKSI
ncbi:glycosyltransferase [Algoriphagus sp. AGSA1]|uniref:glycosyltransferase n=1 Tax=Algoriphagus sp. AGSA1 TaxID=2907213 RepID=UPI001F3E7C77|nr:glycosyltransferase [Algoriphagus sp. AGSA1]MCE7053270.1 glycosyltransferase [Algoriphagus sp. AGSA1]